MTVTSTSGSVMHMRPLPSDSTTQIVPVSATPKFAPLTPTWRVQELLAQVRARRLGQRLGSSESSLPRGDRALEQLADLGPVAVDRGHEDVRGRVAGELDDQLGEVGLDRVDARALRARR